eukprot:scaffold26038_cov65-Phaeocystis_antarctica.AAC.2
MNAIMCLKTDLRSRPDSLIIRDTGPRARARGGGRGESRHASRREWRTAVEEGRTLEVRAYVENKAAQASANWLSGGPFQGQTVPQAALSFGQPRPISRFGGAGRPYRPCFSHRLRARRLVEHVGRARLCVENAAERLRPNRPPAGPASARSSSGRPPRLDQPRPASASLGQLAEPVAAHAVLGRAALSCSGRGAADGMGRMRYRGAAAIVERAHNHYTRILRSIRV